MAVDPKDTAIRPVAKLKLSLSNQGVQEQFRNLLKDRAPAFMASILNLFVADSYLQKCDPSLVIQEAAKAAALDLPIDKSLGLAYIVPYNDKPQFQIGYKGYIQLAQRTNQYKYINAGCIYEGMEVTEDFLTGAIRIAGQKKSDTVIGYFAYFQLLTGFEKALYMTKDEVIAHAKKFSKSYGNPNSAWQTNFDSMALKTPLRLLLSKYGPMTADSPLARALQHDDEADEAAFEEEVRQNANKESLEAEFTVKNDEPAQGGQAQGGEKDSAPAQETETEPKPQPEQTRPATSGRRRPQL